MILYYKIQFHGDERECETGSMCCARASMFVRTHFKKWEHVLKFERQPCGRPVLL